VGHWNVICLASEYDLKKIISFLMTHFERLNPSIQVEAFVSIDGLLIEEEKETNMFGVGASMKEFSQALVIGELFLFRRLVIPLLMCANPLIWWKTHEGQFPNVGFLGKQVLGILGFQIETERMFNLINVLTTLKCYHLQVQNLDLIIIIINNWLDDPR
jgi:uncharacterized Tic20 family protein